jgi:hypothetical protein
VAIFAIAALSPATANATPTSVTVTAVVGAGLKATPPLTLDAAALAQLPQTTATLVVAGEKLTETGPLLTQVVAQAKLRAVTACDDEPLHYWFAVTSNDGKAVVVTSPEFASDGENRTVMLSLRENDTSLAAPRLIVGGDRTAARDLRDVTAVKVGRAATQLGTGDPQCDPPGFKPTVRISHAPAAIGAVIVNGAVTKQTTITFPQLLALRPQLTQVDAYVGEGEQKVHREHGPTLYSVLVRADPALKSLGENGLRYYVEMTSSDDGSIALVSWAEIDPAFDRKPILLSTYEDGDLILNSDPGPRLTAPGDKGGARYDYGIQVVTVFRAP